MQQEAKLTGIRWDYSAKGYNDIIQKEFSEVGDAGCFDSQRGGGHYDPGNL